MEDQEKLKRFAQDQRMNSAVHRVLLASFLKPRKNADVHELAASRIAIDMLQEAWKDIEAHRHIEDDTPDRGGNPGV
jgi:hypothetical protein